MPALPDYNPHVYPFGDQTSRTLTELRTVLSRAENALNEHGAWISPRGRLATQQAAQDEHGNEGLAMVADLASVVNTLSRYRKTKPAPKGIKDELAAEGDRVDS